MSFYDAFDAQDNTAAATAPPPPPGSYNPGAYDKYVTAAVTEEAARVTNAANGTRNHTLNEAAFALYRFTANGVLPREAVEHELYTAARAVGLPHAEIMATLASAYRGRLGKPRHLPTLNDRPTPEVTVLRERHEDPQAPTTDEPTGPLTALEELVNHLPATDKLGVLDRINRRRLDDLALDLYRAHKASAGAVAIPQPVRLDKFLNVPDEDAAYRIDGLWPTGGRILLAAQHKVGKTTMVGNLARCFTDGDKFLGRFPVQTADRVIVFDTELDERMMRRWLRDQGIRNQHRIEALAMRGRLSTFNILDPTIRTQWATVLHGADVLMFDCLRPVLDALGLSEDKDAGRFLEALDELVLEAGIGELLVVHHMGHGGERSRGDSRILDWPEAVWNYRKAGESHTAPREFTAYGRDVDQEALELGYDEEQRRLVATGTRRDAYLEARDAKTDEALDHVLAYLASQAGEVTRNVTENDLRGKVPSRESLRSAIDRGVELGAIIQTIGKRSAKLLRLSSAWAGNPAVRDFAVSDGEVAGSSKQESLQVSTPSADLETDIPGQSDHSSDLADLAATSRQAPPRGQVTTSRRTTSPTNSPARLKLQPSSPSGDRHHE